MRSMFSTYFFRLLSNSISGKFEYPTFVHSLWRLLLLQLLLWCCCCSFLFLFFKDTLCSRKLYVNETIFLTEGTNQTVVKNKNYPASFFETNRSKVRTYSKSYSNLCESILVQSTFFANSVSHLHPSHNSFFPINKTSK